MISGIGNNTNAAPVTSSVGGAPAAAPAPTTGAFAAASATGLGSMMSDNSPLVAGRQITGVVSQFIEHARKFAPEVVKEYAIGFHPLTKNDDPNLYLSSIIVTVSLANNPRAGVGYHTLLLADTNTMPAPAHRTVGDRNVEEVLTYGDAYDDIYAAAVQRQLNRLFPDVPQANFFDADAEVLPEGFNFADANLVAQMLSNAVHAATTVLNSSLPDWRDLQLTQAQTTVLETRLSFHQPQLADTVGQPLRTDIQLLTSEVGNRQQPKAGERVSLNSGQSSKPVGSIAGYLDLIYSPEAGAGNQNPWLAAQQTGPQVFKTYQPAFVITKISADSLASLPGILLNLAMTEGLREGNNWIGALSNAGVSTFANNHDIGAIGLELPMTKHPETGQMTRINTRADSFKPAMLAQLVEAVFHPNLLIQMDIEEVGAQTWLKSVFLNAAQGNPRAIQALFGAANLLTNNSFQRHFDGMQGSAEPVIFNNNRILLGTYVDADGQVRDIRELDYLAVLNLRENDPEFIHLWSDTFVRSDVPMAIRAHTRNQIVRELVGGSFKPTGYAQRVTVNPRFITALAKGVADQNLPIRLITPYSDPTTQTRGSATWLQQYGLTNDGQALFSRGTTNSPSQGFSGGFGGRWG
jgi:hypothetical protein